MPTNLEEQQTAGKNLLTYQRISVKGKVTLEIKMKYAGEEKDAFFFFFKGHISAITLAIFPLSLRLNFV